MNRNDIINFLKNNKKYLKEHYGVNKIGLFGSYARNEADSNSDIDIAVEIDDKFKNLHNFLSLERFLFESLQIKVDLGIESTLRPAVKKFVEKEIIYVK